MHSEAALKMTVRFDHPVKVWVLQLGGWLPIQFTSVTTILVDRCVTIALKNIAARPDRKDMKTERWWLEQLNNARFTLNPILCAAEGKARSEPTYENFISELVEVRETLGKAFPNALILRHAEEHYPILYETVSAAHERHFREAGFLRSVSHILTDRVAKQRSRKFEREVLALAGSASLAPHSFVVLAALSCLYEPQRGEQPQIGRKVLKLSQNYSSEDIHNALADIRSLEYLAAASGLPGSAVGFCTRDKALAAFWTYLGVTDAKWTGETFAAEYRPHQQLFPRLEEAEVHDLLLRLQSGAKHQQGRPTLSRTTPAVGGIEAIDAGQDPGSSSGS